MGTPEVVPDKPENKYKVSPAEDRTLEGIVFASKWEMTGYQVLRPVFGKRLVLQPEYVIQDSFKLPCGKKIREIKYVADFDILPEEGEGDPITLDLKGMETPAFKIKRKMFQYRYRRDVICVKTKRQLKDLIARLVA